MNRRGFIGGLIAALAAPAIIRTPGLLMPVRPSILAVGTWEPPFVTEDLLVTSYERFEVSWSDWRGMWGAHAT